MIRVMQTKFGKDQGNCFGACLASLLEIPLDGIPDFMHHENGRNNYGWQTTLNKWLSQFNLWLFDFYWKPDKCNCSSGDLTHAYCMGSGPSPRGDFWHTVICSIKINENKIEIHWEHDPHPSGDMLKKLVEISFLIPINPGKKS